MTCFGYKFLQKLLSLSLAMSAPITLAANESSLVKVVPLTAQFGNLVSSNPTIELLDTEAKWAEGPLCLTNGSIIWSDIERNQVMIWSEGTGRRVWLSPANYQNGHALDRNGLVVAASHGKRAIERQDENGQWRILIDSYEGKRFNSPNDVVVAQDNAIWFTDPVFGILNQNQSNGGTPQQEGEFLYRYDPDKGIVSRLNTPLLNSPNGLAFSPDHTLLYVADSQKAHNFKNPQLAHRIMVYKLDGNNLIEEKVFTEVSPGIPDGIKVDSLGNVWSSSKEGVHIFSSKGDLLGKILIKSKDTGNLALCTQGKQSWLIVTAANLVLRISINISNANSSLSRELN